MLIGVRCNWKIYYKKGLGHRTLRPLFTPGIIVCFELIYLNGAIESQIHWTMNEPVYMRDYSIFSLFSGDWNTILQKIALNQEGNCVEWLLVRRLLFFYFFFYIKIINIRRVYFFIMFSHVFFIFFSFVYYSKKIMNFN